MPVPEFLALPARRVALMLLSGGTLALALARPLNQLRNPTSSKSVEDTSGFPK